MGEYIENEKRYSYCTDYTDETLKMRLDTKNYTVKEVLGKSRLVGFLGPRHAKRGEQATHSFADVVDRNTGDSVKSLDPWVMGAGPLNRNIYSKPRVFTPIVFKQKGVNPR